MRRIKKLTTELLRTASTSSAHIVAATLIVTDKYAGKKYSQTEEFMSHGYNYSLQGAEDEAIKRVKKLAKVE